MNNKHLALFFSIALTLGIISNASIEKPNLNPFDNDGNLILPMDTGMEVNDDAISKNSLLVKTIPNSEVNPNYLNTLGVKDYSLLSKDEDSSWLKLIFKDNCNIKEKLAFIRNINIFDVVDFDYISYCETVEGNDASINDNQYYFKSLNIDRAWDHLAKNGSNAGGDNNIIAVIDTGVDYTHPDLKDNIWINTKEIPNNNKDDDKNGYVDDYYGVNVVDLNYCDPMDDNGHGTHVAGIIAAANNNIGSTGVAYNSKIMVIKAGNSSGHFLQSNIASAIKYAYTNGADVINMSFGGEYTSLAVQDALQMAYSRCFLVAASGNDASQNEKEMLGVKTKACYPAAYPYVMGVMSSDTNGVESSFTNFDVNPNNNVEYEIYAPGEKITSTIVGGGYLELSGTSMAAPIVSGIASLVISNYKLQNNKNNNFVFSQLLASNKMPGILNWRIHKNNAPIIDAYTSVTNVTNPDIQLYNYYSLDNKKFNVANNGDNVVDSGELIHFGVELKNNGGNANNVTLEVTSKNDQYITIKNTTLNIGNIGCFAIKDGHKILEDGLIKDVEKHIAIQVASNCPNDYIYDLKFKLTYNSDVPNSPTITSKEFVARIVISSGEKLPFFIAQDTTLKAGRKYILMDDMHIRKNATLTVEEGVDIQYYASSAAYKSPILKSPSIKNYGKLIFNGTKEKPINIHPSDAYYDYICNIETHSKNPVIFNYVNCSNMSYITFDVGSFAFNGCNISNTIKHILKQIDLNNEDGFGIAFQSFYILDFINSEIHIYEGEYINVFFGGRVEESIIDVTIDNKIYFSVACVEKNDEIIRTYKNNMFMQKGESGSNYGFYSNIYNGHLEEGSITGNTFLYDANYQDINSLPKIEVFGFEGDVLFQNNEFLGVPKDKVSSLIIDQTNGGMGLFKYSDATDESRSNIRPHVSAVTLKNAKGEVIDTVSNEIVTFEFKFNKPMDINQPFYPSFGSRAPYDDYQITGKFIDERTWVGDYYIESFIEGGKQQFKFLNGFEKAAHGNSLIDTGFCYSFIIDMTNAHAMNLSATYENGAVHLSWMQDDYPTILGYNLYRYDTAHKTPVKLNNTVIPANINNYIDTTFNPGSATTYYFTAVFSDFTESKTSGKTIISTPDTIAPRLYHNVPTNANKTTGITIKCTALDNDKITSVYLYYKDSSATSFTKVSMSKQNNLYYYHLDLSSINTLEYYIVANDTTLTIQCGDASKPNVITVTTSDVPILKGDIDGDGKLSIKDALLGIAYLGGNKELTPEQISRGDLNGDGYISSNEMLLILQYLNGKVTEL